MWYVFATIAFLFVSLLDGHSASMVAMLLLLLLGSWSVNTIRDPEGRRQGAKVLGVIFSVYVISALIVSQSFLNGKFFYVSDSAKYIENYLNVNSWSFGSAILNLMQTYFFFIDDNGLFNEGLSLWSYIANHYIDGSTVFYMTLFQTLFGVLSALEIFKIFNLYFQPNRAARYTCIFALLSLFHIYSTVIIRDIVIAYFYMLGLRKIMSESKVSDIFVLLLVMVVTMGVRLYSGLFFGAFIMFWLYKLLRSSKYSRLKIVIVPLVIVGIIFIGTAVASSVLMEGAEGEVEHYDELYADGSGFAGRLRLLPVGIRHIAILFFSQLPLDDLSRFMLSNSFSNYYITILVIIYLIFGFVVFYGLMYYCFFKGFFKEMDSYEKWILIIMLGLVALTLSTHMDVRRSMQAIPFFYLFYLICSDKYGHEQWQKTNRYLVGIGVFIMIAYAIVT